MKTLRLLFRCFLSPLVVLSGAAAASADDWPQWLGPRRDAVWRETGIVEKFPTNGLTFRWRTPIGAGYSE
jgi:outer membrane protein assembly factor BamB